MRTRTIRQTLTFRANPREVYENITDSKKTSMFTDGKARIARAVGGKFTMFDGYIDGTILELVPGEKIVQSWRADEKGWPKDHFSKAVFALSKVREGTRVSLTQNGVPEACYEHISKGWREFYWTPLMKELEKKNNRGKED
jgi:activator of HSP90 ATPase